MILNVDFVYQATVRPRRKRLHEDRHYVATQPVEVREVEPALAPVALRTLTERLRDGKQVREYRLFEDGLWAPVTERDSAAPLDAGWLADEASAVHRDPHAYSNAFDATVQNRMGVRGRQEDDATAAHLLGSDRDERAAGVREAAARYLLIAGIPHARAPEPVYDVSESNGGTAFVHVEPYRTPEGEQASNFAINLFRADERGFMMGTHDVYESDRENRIEVLIPEALRAPVAERALYSAAKVMRDDLGRKALERDVAFFAIYAAVRDGMRDLGREIAVAEKGGPAPACEAIVAALAEAVRVMKEVDRDFGRRLSVEWSEKALARIEERQLAMVPAFGS